MMVIVRYVWASFRTSPSFLFYERLKAFIAEASWHVCAPCFDQSNVSLSLKTRNTACSQILFTSTLGLNPCVLRTRCTRMSFPFNHYVSAADLRNSFISQQQRQRFVYSADVFVLPVEYLLVLTGAS